MGKTGNTESVLSAAIRSRAVRIIPGGTFALDAPTARPTIWGRGQEILWVPGEPLLVAGPTGVGKTTLKQRLMLATIGIGEPEVLGYPVAQTDGGVLYMAMDRPAQARRSLRRMVAPADRDTLNERVTVWRGPPDFSVLKDPALFPSWVRDIRPDARIVVLDALKDFAPRLSSDETGAAISTAWNAAVADDLEVLVGHHQRKANSDNRRPKTLDDVFGSGLFVFSAGSVLLLWGVAGDEVIEVRHLKPPADQLSPFQMHHEMATGALSVVEGQDLLSLVRKAPQGITVPEATLRLYGSAEGTHAKSNEARVRREFKKLGEMVHYREGKPLPGQGAQREPGRFYATTLPGVTEATTAED